MQNLNNESQSLYFLTKRNREESASQEVALWRQGEKDKARNFFKKAVDVTNEMVLKVIEVCIGGSR